MRDIIDAQLHLFEANSPTWPWDPSILRDPALAGMRGRFGAHSASPSEVLDLLDQHGVHGALVVHPSIYGYDNSYSTTAYQAAPDRFRVIGHVDSSRSDIEELLEGWAADPAFVGLRLNLWADEAVAKFRAGGDDRMLAAAQRVGLRVCVNAPGRFADLDRLARTFAEAPLIVDHLGLFNVGMLDPEVTDTFVNTDGLLALARYEHVAVKVTSVPLLSRERYPFRDAWPHLDAVLEAFGVQRLMWGSDATVFDHPYAETLDFLTEFVRDRGSLSEDEVAMLLGGALRRVWGWPRESAAGPAETASR